METIKIYIFYIISCFVSLPFVITYIVYLLNKKLYKHKWRAIHQSAQLTNVFYVFACIIIVQLLFNVSLFWMIVLLHLILWIVMIVYQWKKDTEISLKRSFKIVWRASFLIFFVSYFILTIYGIFTYSF